MNESTLEGDVVLTYVFGGISSKNHRPYLQVSDGIEAKFLKLDKSFAVTPDTFEAYERGDGIKLRVRASTNGFEVLEVL